MPNQNHIGPRSARALTAKGRGTRAAILDTALEVFSEQGVFAASVSEISRRCGLAQGTFYQYFNTKEQVLLELTDRTVNNFWNQARALELEGRDLPGCLEQVVGLLFTHTKQNFAFHRILGELELIDPVTIAYYDSIARFCRGFIRDMAAAGSIRPIDPNLFAYGLMGMAHFFFPDWGPKIETYPLQQGVGLAVDLIRKGIMGPSPWRRPADLALSSRPAGSLEQDAVQPELSQGKKSRQAIFEAAERIFGQLGYNRASIAEITREAGVAQGTFYVYFKSKLELLEGVIAFQSRSLRSELRRATQHCQDRRDAEREGMLAFYDFLRHHRELYRTVAECESISPEAAKMYYSRLATPYLGQIRQGIDKGQVRDLPPSFLVRSLMGFNHMIGLKWLIWNSSPYAEVPHHLMGEAVEFVMYGLDPS
jgi:AcrR family transcriptional regulator